MNDELLIYRGQDYKISKYITIHHPTLDEICDYGEQKYFNLVYNLTSVGADLKWQLNEIGVDYTKVSDFELFYSLLINGITKEQTSILFGELDFSKFEVYVNTLNNEICMVQEVISVENQEKVFGKLDKVIKSIMKIFHLKTKTIRKETTDKIIIDSFTYQVIVDYIRKMHGLKRSNQIPANEHTKQILIEDAKEEYERNKNKEYKSTLLNLISTMVNSSGFKYNNDTVWNMKINVFFDSVKRIQKINTANLLLQSGYSGYGISFKDIDKKQLDWLGELE